MPNFRSVAPRNCLGEVYHIFPPPPLPPSLGHTEGEMWPDIDTKIITLATLIPNILYVHGFNLQAVGARRKYIDTRNYNSISILAESAQVMPTLHKKWNSLLID